MARTKGTSLLNNRSWIAHKHGAEGWSRLAAALDPADRAVVETAVAVGWYDLGVEIRMLHAMQDHLFEGALSPFDEMASWIAEHDLGGVQRLFLRLANPAFVLEKAMSYWGRYYDSGRWVITRPPDGADARLVDFAMPDELFCRGTTAYTARMFELVGAKAVRVEHTRCRSRGDAECLFLCHFT